MPSVDEWNEIEGTFPEIIEEIDEVFSSYDVHPENSRAKKAAYYSKLQWSIDLVNRLRHARWSYVMVMYLSGIGIPDEVWKKAPDQGEFAMTYFPNFTNEDSVRKAQFDYFADCFFFKLYSSLDTLGHLLIAIYDVRLTGKPDFHRVLGGLKSIRPELHSRLTALINSEDFAELKELRHDSTHNEALGSVNSFANQLSTNHITSGAGKYITSSEIVESVKNSIKVLVELLTAVRDQLLADRYLLKSKSAPTNL